jgi:hypothetical protein
VNRQNATVGSLIVILASAFAAVSQNRPAKDAYPVASSDEVAIVRTVLTSNGLPGLMENWGVDDPEALIVLSDTLTGCVLPPSESEVKRVNDAIERITRGATVSDEELRHRAPVPYEDLIVGPGRRVDKSIVRACPANGSVRVRAVLVDGPVRVVLEREDVIRRQFRVDPAAWERPVCQHRVRQLPERN